jgi:protein SCO1/2
MNICVSTVIRLRGLALMLAVFTAAHCARSADATNIRTFQVKGVIKTLKPAEKTAIIRHEEIPGYMAAMTMPFSVKDAGQLKELRSGDNVSFRYIVTPDDEWIEAIARLAPASPPTTAQSRQPKVPPPLTDLLRVGDALPEVQLTNHLGQVMRTTQFKGGPLAITFIYTRCAIGSLCPHLTRQFAEAAQELAASTNGHFMLVTLDPQHDTHEILNRFAATYKLAGRPFDLATGDGDVVARFAGQCGVVTISDAGKGTHHHNLRTLIVDARGRIRRILKGNAWTGVELAAAMRGMDLAR